MDKLVEQSLTHWLKAQKKACGVYLNLCVLFGILNGIALVCQAFFIARILDAVIMGGKTADQLLVEFSVMIVLFCLRAVLAYGRERASFAAGQQLRAQIRHLVLDKLERLGPAFIKGKPAGNWASIVLEQVEDLHDFYGRYLPQMSLAAFIPLIILVAVFPLNWAAGVILLMTAPLIPLFMVLVGMGASDANRKNFSALARLSGHFMDRLKGLNTIKLFYRGEHELAQIEKASEEFRSRTMAVLRMAFLSSAVLEFFAAVSIAVLAVYFGFSYLGHLDFGHYGVAISLFTGMFILILAPEFYQPLRDMGTHYHAKAQAIGAAESLMALLTYPEHAVSDASEEHQSVEPTLASPSDALLVINQLTVLSHQGSVLLGPISFEVGADEHLAIVGPSGAGKTSLLNALLGFLPYQGEILLNGVELKQWDIARWRQSIAWLGQEPQLFHGTVRSNVTLGNATLNTTLNNRTHSDEDEMSSLSDEAVYALLDKAYISDFVRAQPCGLDHPVDEHNLGLSVGQTQRIALARALAQNAPLYLLDEPSASLDSQSERLVLQALDKAMAGKACLMVTHKLDELSHMDKILVIDQGLIVQSGTFASLSHQPGLFLQLLEQGMDENVSVDMPTATMNHQGDA